MPTANINILAVLVAAVLTFVLGAVWYSPVLFAKQWMAAQGYTPEKLEEMKRRGVPDGAEDEGQDRGDEDGENVDVGGRHERSLRSGLSYDGSARSPA